MDQILFRHQNREASIPLVIPTPMECNTAQDKVLANVLANSKRPQRWINRVEPHDRTAIICGSGPSIERCIDEIAALDGDIFALNNAANWLWKAHQIIPDFQVIMDAQPRTVELIGPARTHLFASMVDPELFDRVPTAVLWHSTHGDFNVDEQPGFPFPEEGYCLIGSGSTVGNTSLPLVYAMGYRKIHIFGMDSSHSGASGHVLPQSINDGDPCTLVDFMGKQYVCSFVMKLQADNFLQRANALIEGGCTIEVHGEGYLPDLWRASRGELDERTKYEIMWSMPEYRDSGSPGAESAAEFVRVARPKYGQMVADLGCGPGLGGLEVARLSRCGVTFVDFARNCGAPDPFMPLDLSADPLPRFDFGFCCDVMEHIPPQLVAATLANICRSAPFVFFRISLLDDSKGALIGHRLHLSVHDSRWWMRALSEHGQIAYYRDYEHTAAYYVKTNQPVGIDG